MSRRATIVASVTIDGSNGRLLGGSGALSAAPAAGLYQVLLERRVAVGEVVCLASARGPVETIVACADPIAQNIVQVWVVDQAGNLTNPTAIDVTVLEV